MRRTLAAFVLSVICATGVSAEPPKTVQAPVWVYLENVPGAPTAGESGVKRPPVRELEEIARFVLGGMIYGWKFSYVPSDVKRNVAERFELVPIRDIAADDPRFSVDTVTPAYPRLTCWARFAVDETAARWMSYWDSVQFKSASGRGTGERSAETAGIRDAYADAVKLAVRGYARKLEKNKPKEISGEILLRDSPRLFSESGQFVAEVRLLVNIRELVPYRAF